MEPSEDKSIQASAIFNKHAEAYQNRFMNVDLYKDSLNTFCDTITQKSPQVLDIACGPGNVAKYLLSRRPDLLLLGLDLAPKMIDLANRNNPNAHFEVMDCRSINKLVQKFHAVICSFCLPYISSADVNHLIHNIGNLLFEKSVLYISTIEGNYTNSGYKKSSQGDLVFMHYYDEAYLTKELKKNGFFIFDISRKENVTGNGEKMIDLIIIAKKRLIPQIAFYENL